MNENALRRGGASTTSKRKMEVSDQIIIEGGLWRTQNLSEVTAY